MQRRFVPKTPVRTVFNLRKKLFGEKVTDVDAYVSMIGLSGCVGANVGAGYGIYTGYLSHRQDSYYNCALNTTFSGLFGAFGGAYAGIFLSWLSPILTPVCSRSGWCGPRQIL